MKGVRRSVLKVRDILTDMQIKAQRGRENLPGVDGIFILCAVTPMILHKFGEKKICKNKSVKVLM